MEAGRSRVGQRPAVFMAKLSVGSQRALWLPTESRRGHDPAWRYTLDEVVLHQRRIPVVAVPCLVMHIGRDMSRRLGGVDTPVAKPLVGHIDARQPARTVPA